MSKTIVRKALVLLLALVLLAGCAMPAWAASQEEGQLAYVLLDHDPEGLPFENPDKMTFAAAELWGLVPGQPVDIFVSAGPQNPVDGDQLTASPGLEIQPLKELYALEGENSRAYVRLIAAEADKEYSLTGPDGSAITVHTSLPEYGLYAQPQAQPEHILQHGQMVPWDGTVYAICTGEEGAEVEAAIADPEDAAAMDVEKTADGVFAITCKEEVWQSVYGSGRVWTADVAFSKEGQPLCTLPVFFDMPNYPVGKHLSFTHLQWDQEKGQNTYQPDHPDTRYEDEVWQVGPQWGPEILVGYAQWNQQGQVESFEPLPMDQLEFSPGLTATPLDTEPQGCCFQLRATDVDMDYEIGHENQWVTVHGELPHVGFYTQPQADPDSFVEDWAFLPVDDGSSQTIYLVDARQGDEDAAHMEAAALKGQTHGAKLEKTEEGVYSLTLSTKEVLAVAGDGFKLKVRLTMKDPDGSAWEEEQILWVHPHRPALVYSEENLQPAGWDAWAPFLYEEVKDKVSTSLTLKEGEPKVIYLYRLWRDPGSQKLYLQGGAPEEFASQSSCFKLESLATKPGLDNRFKITGQAAGSGTVDLLECQLQGAVYPDGREDEWNSALGEALPNIGYKQVLPKGDVLYFDGDFHIKKKEDLPFAWAGELDRVSQQVRPLAVAVEKQEAFTDVDPGQYYAEPVAWAVANGIAQGKTPTSFQPGAVCSRGEIVTFLWRSQGCPEPKTTVSPFTDVQDKNAYYYKAVLWAVEQEITGGKSAKRFAPQDSCTRGQAVTFLWRAKGKPDALSASAFKDVKTDSYYAGAVNWAVAKGVTKGKTATRFAPDSSCSRGEIVTFLYRAHGVKGAIV